MMLSEFEHGQIVGCYLATNNIHCVSRILKLPVSTVHYWIQRYKQTDAVELMPNFGRPKKTSQRADRLLYFLARANGFATSTDLLRLWRERGCHRTVLRLLHARHLRQYRPVRVPLLTKDQKRTRLEWAMRRCHWRSLWKRIVWSDESRFLLHPVSGRTLVWRFPGERLNEKFLVQVTQAGGGSVHVWGAIWIGGRSELVRLQGTVNAVSYCDVLHGFFSSSVLPAHSWFQHDNAPAHRFWITSQLFEDMSV